MFLWDVYLSNEKDTESFSKPKLTSVNSFAIIYHNGTVMFGRKLISKVRCQMHFETYPHDTQACQMKFQSYSFLYPIFNFIYQAVRMHPQSVTSSVFDVIGTRSYVHKVTWFSTQAPFCEFVFEIQVKRRLQYYLYQVSTIF